MIQDEVDVISDAQANLYVINKKISLGDTKHARIVASKMITSLIKIDQKELAKDVSVILNLIDQNDMSKMSIVIQTINGKLDRILKSEGQFKVCRKCGWKNTLDTNYCSNCRYVLS